MKKYMTALLALALALGALTACGAKQDNSEAVEVDLPAFYAELEKKFQWNEGYMVDLEGEMLESYYPGISDIPVTQFVAKAPMMSSGVSLPSGLRTAQTLWPVASMAPVSWVFTWPVWAAMTAS